MDVAQWFWNFTVYSFGGYLLERFFAAVTHAENQTRRCFWVLPLCPVYGLALTAVLALPQPLRQLPWLPLTGAVVTTAVEYAVHWAYDALLGVRFWDYSAVSGNLGGRVCLPFSIAWGVLTTAALVWFQPALHSWILGISPAVTLTAMALVSADALCSVRYLFRTHDVSFGAVRGNGAQ